MDEYKKEALKKTAISGAKFLLSQGAINSSGQTVFSQGFYEVIMGINVDNNEIKVLDVVEKEYK